MNKKTNKKTTKTPIDESREKLIEPKEKVVIKTKTPESADPQNPPTPRDKNEKKLAAKLKSKWVNANLTAPLIILATLVVGIGIAIWISFNKVVRKEALKSDAPLLEIKKDSKTLQKITFKDIEENITLDAAFSPELEKNLLAQVIKFLYQKELRASKDYASIYNQSFASLQEFEEISPLKDLSEIEKQSKNTINDLKNSFQQSYGIHNWPEAFAIELAKEEFGKSKSEEEAIAHLNTNAMKKAAFGPWILSFNNSFNLAHKNGILLSKDLLAEEGGQLKTFKKAGENFGLSFLSKAKVDSNVKNEDAAKQKVVALLSNSYEASKKDVFDRLTDFLIIKGYRIFWKQPLPFKINRLHNRITFSITKENLKKLLQLLPSSYVNKRGKEVSFYTRSVFESLFEIPGIKEIVDSHKPNSSKENSSTTKQVDSFVLQSQLSQIFDESSPQLSSQPQLQLQQQTKERPKTFHIKTLFEISEEDLEIAPAFLSSLFEKKILEADTIKNLVEALREEMFPQLQFPSNKETISRTQMLFINQEMSNLIDSNPEAEAIFNKVMQKFFVTKQLGGQKISTVFGILDKKLLFGKNDVFIINTLENSQYDKLLSALLQRLAENGPNPLEFNRVFEDFENENKIYIETLKNPEFVKYLLDQPNPLKESKNFTMEELEMFLRDQNNKLTATKEAKILKIFDTFNQEIQALAASNTNADLTFVDKKLFFSVDLNSKNSTKKPYIESFSKVFREEFGT